MASELGGPTPSEELRNCAQEGDVDGVKSAIRKGAIIDERSSFLMDHPTALTCASESGHLEIVKILIENGADINLADGLSWTPLIHASKKGHKEILQFLMSKGANANYKDSDGKDALMYASNQEIKEILQKEPPQEKKSLEIASRIRNIYDDMLSGRISTIGDLNDKTTEIMADLNRNEYFNSNKIKKCYDKIAKASAQLSITHDASSVHDSLKLTQLELETLTVKSKNKWWQFWK